jgi:hypothetical protein
VNEREEEEQTQEENLHPGDVHLLIDSRVRAATENSYNDYELQAAAAMEGEGSSERTTCGGG